jgi:DNA-binding transcriptional ArsR family regulator
MEESKKKDLICGVVFNQKEIQRLRKLYRLFSNKDIAKMLEKIKSSDNKLMVKDIWNDPKIKIGQSLTSIYLSRLKSFGIVNATRAGRNQFYSVNLEKLEDANSLLAEFNRKFPK